MASTSTDRVPTAVVVIPSATQSPCQRPAQNQTPQTTIEEGHSDGCEPGPRLRRHSCGMPRPAGGSRLHPDALFTAISGDSAASAHLLLCLRWKGRSCVPDTPANSQNSD